MLVGENESLMELILRFLLQLVLPVGLVLGHLPLNLLLLSQKSCLLLWVKNANGIFSNEATSFLG